MGRLMSKCRAIVDTHGLDDPCFLTALALFAAAAAVIAFALVGGAQ